MTESKRETVSAEYGVQPMWEVVFDQIGRQLEGLSALDTKAGILVGFLAASLAEIVGALVLGSLEHHDAMENVHSSVKWFLATAVLSIVIGAACGVWSLLPQTASAGWNFYDRWNSKRRDKDGVGRERSKQTPYASGQNVRQMVEDIQNQYNVAEQNFAELLEVYVANHDLQIKKALRLRWSSGFAGVAILFLSITAFWVMVSH